MKTQKTPDSNDPIASTEKKLRNVRTLLYVLVLVSVTKIATMDFYESSFRTWINVVVIFIVVLCALAIENGLRKKLKAEKKKGKTWERPTSLQLGDSEPEL